MKSKRPKRPYMAGAFLEGLDHILALKSCDVFIDGKTVFVSWSHTNSISNFAQLDAGGTEAFREKERTLLRDNVSAADHDLVMALIAMKGL